MDDQAKNNLQIRLSSLLFVTAVAGLVIALLVSRARYERQINDLKVQIEELKDQLPEYHLVRQLQDLKVELTELQTKLGPSHPKVVALGKQIQMFEQRRQNTEISRLE